MCRRTAEQAAACRHVQLIHDNNIIYMKQTNLLNNYILITQPYGKCKESYTSVRRTAHKILFIIGRRIPNMPHVEGDDDGVGYGVFGKSSSGNGVFGKSPGGNGVYGLCDDGCGVYGVSGNGTGLYGESGMYYAAILNGKVK